MIEGARRGRPPVLLRPLAAALPSRLDAFVLPGMDIARANGLDLEAAGLRAAATPRHAACLLVVGELPEGLRRAAVVAYAQMMRPRVIVALSAGELAPLPAPNVVAGADQEGLEYSVGGARRILREEAWSPEAQPFEAEGLVPKRRKKKVRREQKSDREDRADHRQMDHGQMSRGSKEKGATKQGGMDHGVMETRGTNHGQTDHGSKGEAATRQGGVDHGQMDHGQMVHGSKVEAPTKRGGMDHGAMKKGGKDHGSMDHGGMEMGFMSMVRLTQHLPRSADGLPMERVQAPFGPFFPGLPSGLGLTLWLDGDTVARVDLAQGVTSRGIEESLTGEPAELAGRLSRVDPFAPDSYRRLALLALQWTGGRDGHGDPQPGWVVRAELERAASHLNWLAGFGRLLGFDRLVRQATHWQLVLRRGKDPESLARLEPALGKFLAGVPRAPLLGWKLKGVGRLAVADLEGVSGPVARAAGLERDARLADAAYREFDFRPVLRRDGDALARLEVRLEEIRQSVALARSAANRMSSVQSELPQTPPQLPATLTSGEATVETPRGRATLTIEGDSDHIAKARLETPSSALVKLINGVAVDLELADALIAIASLDISPWEVDP